MNLMYGWFMGRRILAPRRMKAVSLVDAGANNRVFAFTKRKAQSDGDASAGMTKAELKAALKKADIPEDMSAAIMESLNLLMPFKDKLPADALDLLADFLDLSFHTEEEQETKMTDNKKMADGKATKASASSQEAFDELKAKYDATCKELSDLKAEMAKMKKGEEPDGDEIKKAKGVVVLTKAERGEFPLKDGELDLSAIAHDQTAQVAVRALYKAHKADEAREIAELTKRAGDEFPHVGDTNETARLLKSFGKDEGFVKMLTALEAAQAQLIEPRGAIRTANVFKAAGNRIAKFNARVEEVRKERGLDVRVARGVVAQEDPEGAEAFYGQYQ